MKFDETDLELIKLVVTSVVAIIVGVVTAYIAWQQCQIARRQANIAEQAKQVATAKLNFDLFEKRYRLYELLRNELLEIVICARRYDPSNSKYILEIPKFAFLFGADITDYIGKIDDTHRALRSIWEREAKGVSEDERERSAEMLSWLNKQGIECYKRFKPYLDFSEWQDQDWARTRVLPCD